MSWVVMVTDLTETPLVKAECFGVFSDHEEATEWVLFHRDNRSFSIHKVISVCNSAPTGLSNE